MRGHLPVLVAVVLVLDPHPRGSFADAGDAAAQQLRPAEHHEAEPPAALMRYNSRDAGGRVDEGREAATQREGAGRRVDARAGGPGERQGAEVNDRLARWKSGDAVEWET